MFIILRKIVTLYLILLACDTKSGLVICLFSIFHIPNVRSHASMKKYLGVLGFPLF